ncbi:MAG: type I methionyl aminopeptidase [Bacilli bacterium]|nr:type I methionyl aminopeptidase [Bacilli bacterium]
MLNSSEISLMRLSGNILSNVLKEIKEFCIIGNSTLAISKKAEEIIRNYGGEPAFLNYKGFPESICISINDTLIHGIPKKDIFLKDGDIVSIDVGVVYKGYYTDACRTFFVGHVSDQAQKIVKIAEECFFNAVNLIKPGVHLGDISYTIGQHAQANGFSIPRDFTGHGIGKNLHEPPFIPNYGVKGTGVILREGMCLAIEPMIAAGTNEVKILNDGWTVKMLDGKLSAHYENTVLVTNDGYEILTK